MSKPRKPTAAMIAKAQRELHQAQTAESQKWSHAIDVTPHRHDEPCGQILARAAPELRAEVDAARAKIDTLKDAAVARGLAYWGKGLFWWINEAAR